MKCMKIDYYIKRTASASETQLLFQDLEKLVKSGDWILGRTQCDRIIRACNAQLGLESLDFGHISQLIKLVELAIHGYDINTLPQNSPLYMEKIMIHIIKKLSSLQVHSLCSSVAELLYIRLTSAQPGEVYYVVVRNCFSILWNGVSTTTKILNPKDKLQYQFQALNFLLLLDKESAIPSISKAPIYTEGSVSEFAKSCEVVSEEDASFVLHEMHSLFSRCLSGSQDCKSNGSTQCIDTSNIYTLLEMALVIVKMLCKAGHHCQASIFLNEIGVNFRSNAAALELGKLAIKIHSTVTPDERSDEILRECTRVLRSLPPGLGECEAHSVLEGCGLLVWVVEDRHKKGFTGPVLLAWFSFLEVHQDHIRMILKKFDLKGESNRLQQALCFSIYQGFGFAYESLLESQLEDSGTLARVLLYCQATIGHMMTEMHKLSNENLLIKAVIAVSNFTCGLYNLSLYDEAFTLLEILCHDLSKNCPPSLSVDRLNRPFMLAVQTSRKTGHLERALDWVISWLKALGDKMALHKTEPVSLWVKTKIDAARNSEADLRLRTIRDGFGPDIPDERTMLCLLDEELRLYKEDPGDTSQERYNTLCDLLDICHEESAHTHLRAVYLCEVAQVVCFQDFSEQTDCMAVDFTHEALRLLEEEPEFPENANQLKDDKAHALLWLFICTLEKNLQEAIERDVKLQEMRKHSQCIETPIGTNDLDYEKQKNEDILVCDGLHFNLAGQNKLCQPLGLALTEWATLLRSDVLPSLRNPKQTSKSIVITASLFQLMGKPLQALEAYQLAIELSHQLADTQSCAYSLCHSASVFLELGCTEMALTQIERAEKMVTTDKSIEGLSSLSLLIILLKSQCCYNAGLVECGVSYLCDVLKEASEQKRSKSSYMLRAQALQTCSSYLSLDAISLPQTQRSRITQLGYTSPDTVLCESLKLFSSLVVTFVGRGLYGDYRSGSDVRFIDTGSNLVFKWRLLSELLTCSMKMIALRASCGAINDARLQCREALRLSIKLQALSQCTELLVVKAELDLMQGEIAESKFDLDKVRNLLEINTDVSDPECKSEVKIKPRKGRPLQKACSPLPVMEDDLKDILSTRWTVKEPIVRDQASSPVLKAQPRRWLSCLTHKQTCQCPCCSEPLLGRVTARWAAAQAHMVLQLDPSEPKVGFKLHWATLARCKMITGKLEAKLAEFIPLCGPVKGSPKASLMYDLVGRAYLHMAVSSLEPSHSKVCSIWKVLEAGLTFVESVSLPELRTVKAGLMATKALVSLVTLSTKKDCRLEELFPNVWTFRSPTQTKVGKSHQSSLKEHKSLSMSEKKKPVKVSKLKIQIPTSTSKGKGSGLTTPVVIPMTPFSKTPVLQSKSSKRELSAFDFNAVVPTFPFTPVQKSTVQTSQKTASKLQFQVFDEFLPTQNKVQPVPAAPRRIKKSRFKIDFSDESDGENDPQQEPLEKLCPKKTTRQGTLRGKATSATFSKKILPARQAKSNKSYALPRDTSSEDETLVYRASSKRRGRARKVSGKALELEEPDKMRSIGEETDDVLDLTFEYLDTSDAEAKDLGTSDLDLEVLRRDLCSNFEMNDLFDKSLHKARGLQPHNTHVDPGMDDLSFEDIQVLLRSAWLALQHFPPLSIFPTICAFLALSIGHQDPTATAMLHCQSLGITSRHRTIRHLASSRKKLKKASSELADQMDNLTLDESSPTTPTDQRLSQVENIFSFPTADCSAFPQFHSQEFIQQIQYLPSGVTVCVMSVLGVKAGEMGESILLSRLEKGSAPVTVHIPTSAEPLSIRQLVKEMDSILVDQKALSSISEKEQWWEGRRALDYRVEQLLKEMERLLGCWKSLLLPLSLDTKLSARAQHLSKILCDKGVKNSEVIIKSLLSATSVVPKKDLRSFALGVCPDWDDECEALFRSAVLQVTDEEKPSGHVVLILDKYLQRLPWESMSILRSRSVSRMPSLQSLIGLCIQKENDSHSILKHGVDTKNTFYVLDPDGNLEHSQQQFKEWFQSQSDWDGVCGHVPKLGQLEEAVATKDLYVYVGHGAGARFLDSQAVLTRPMRAASLLIGCSSAALAVRGDQEGQGIILNYLIAGCPFVLGNLWDVTDRDIDRFTKALLESWLSSESGSALLDYMGPSRQATHLKHLIGAAPVVYGLPIHLR